MKSIAGVTLLLGSLFVPNLVYGQLTDTSTPTSFETNTATSRVPAQTFTITVGKADHKFVPDVTQANVGDIIEFQFFPPNHSVVRAEYGYPCIPYEKTGRGKVGFFAGFHPVDAILDVPPKWTIKINDTNPIFFYCSAPGSCIRYGMVGVINPNATTSLAKQKQEAKDSAYMLQPGEDFPDEAATSSSPTITATSSSPAETTEYYTSSISSTSTTAAASTPTPSEAAKKNSSLSTGAIAGIAVGGAIVLGLAIALFYMLGRHKTLTQVMKGMSSSSTTNQPPPPGPQMRSNGYPSTTGPDVPPYTSIAHDGRDLNAHYSDVSVYPKPYPQHNIDEVYPPTPGSDMANKMPPRWSNLDPNYHNGSPPPPGSPYLNMGNIEQTRLAQNASPSAMSEQQLDGQMSPTRPRAPVELAAQVNHPTGDNPHDFKFR